MAQTATVSLRIPQTLVNIPGWNQAAYNLTIRAMLNTSIIAWGPGYAVNPQHIENVFDMIVDEGNYSLLETIRDTAMAETLPARSLTRH
jgi:hypothetical protein